MVNQSADTHQRYVLYSVLNGSSVFFETALLDGFFNLQDDEEHLIVASDCLLSKRIVFQQVILTSQKPLPKSDIFSFVSRFRRSCLMTSFLP